MHEILPKNLNTLDHYREAAALKDRSNASLAVEKLLEDESFFQFDSREYGDIQAHSSCVDRILDISVPETEKALRDEARKCWPEGTVESWSKNMHDGAITWVGLNPAQLQTPYAEIYDLLCEVDPEPGQRVVDLGAGYGRMGVVLGQLWPSCEFVGFEMAPERVELGNKAFERLEMSSAKLEQGNVADSEFELPSSDYYFIYDFGSLSDQKKLLEKIEDKADQKKAFSVLARGRGINALIQETAPWLTIDTKKVGNTMVYSFY